MNGNEDRGIWDWITDRAENHPIAFRRVTAMIFTMLLAYVILGWLNANQTSHGREVCERGNASRLADLRQSTALESIAERKELLAEAHHFPEQAHIYRDEAAVYRQKIKQLVEIASISGHQAAPEAVTISCPDDWPSPIPWFEQGGS